MASYDKNTRLVFALASGANVAQAARKSGCSAKTVFRRLKDDAFRHEVARARGHVGEADLSAVKLAGYTDAQLIEIVQHVALNTWTNYVNEVFKTDIDFPVVEARKAA